MDLQAIIDIGEIQLEKINKKGGGMLEIFVEDPSDGGEYPHAIGIKVDLVSKSYVGLELDEYRNDYKLKYLYRRGSTRGADLTPTAKIAAKPQNTIQGKICAAYADALKQENLMERFEQEAKELELTLEVINRHADKILADLLDRLKDIPKKEGAFLTVIVLSEDGVKKYIGDYQVFLEKVVADAMLNFHYSKANKKDLIAQNATCAVCLKSGVEVYGLASAFAFHTYDKKGYIAGGFDYEKAWRNYPVCSDCAVKQELGKKYLDEYLNFPFYGRRFYLIPQPVLPGVMPTVLTKLRRLTQENLSDAYVGMEDRILRGIADEENSVSFGMLFYEKKKEAMNILLDIQDVMPSRLKKVYETMEQTNMIGFFRDFRLSEKKNTKIVLGFYFLNTLFPRDTYNRYFLEAIDAIIGGKPLKYQFLLHFIMEYITECFDNEQKEGRDKRRDSCRFATLKSYALLIYLKSLGVFENTIQKGGLNKMEQRVWEKENYNSQTEMFEDFFIKNFGFFDLPSKKGLFMVGFLAAKLLNWQALKENGRKPLIPKLKGLKLNKMEIKRLLPEIQNKLIEYDVDYYHEAQTLAATYLVEAGENWGINDLDVPFYFSLGLNMASLFKLGNKKEEVLPDETE